LTYSYLNQIRTAIDLLASLPLIGPKTATKLAFWIIEAPKSKVDKLLDTIRELKDSLEPCRQCFSLTVRGRQPCDICQDRSRQRSICVVESAMDVFHIESSGTYNGYYHVLQGLISPLEGIGPGELRIEELLQRLQKGNYDEVILALPPTVDGDMTSMYIAERIRERQLELTVTRLGFGLPVGSTIDYADSLTLAKALENRKPI